MQGNAEGMSAEERAVRIDLAAFYRIVHAHGLTDLIHNHITARVPGSQDHFLINAFGLDYSEITASSLVKIDLEGKAIDAGSLPRINRAGFFIHSAIHAARHDLGCIAHVHTPATVAVASLACGLLPVNQSALRFDGDLAYHDYEGPVFRSDEGQRLIESLGTCDNMILRNHGVLCCGPRIPHAYVNLMAMEAVCRTQIQLLSCGQPIRPISPAAVQEARRIFAIAREPGTSNVADYPGPQLEWAAARRVLDRSDTSYQR